ncbi:hypothetical protein C8N24_1176 [Solirubrobacter pauli]|uniref:Dolichyl-phosphate-mannose-protein mannosyltransferase n=1 Tax=Solirubrobacter pauli TaxID=166793 RepID=A0A660LEM3_9ACTN|nr:hypothetical protein [Solirubrobacter pauli]RKQ91354.1 hypothetical protein C8N24_1176 [Solirubrobacter pauli]
MSARDECAEASTARGETASAPAGGDAVRGGGDAVREGGDAARAVPEGGDAARAMPGRGGAAPVPWRGRASVGAATAAIVLAVLARLLYGRGTVGYDAAWALLWGEQLADGRVPTLDADGAPTPHPLAIAVYALSSPFGGTELVTGLSWLAFGALGVVAYALGAAVYSRWVGALFAALLLTRPLLVLEAGQAIIDVPFLALVLAAMLAEVRRPRTGWAVPVLLGLAGLLRPEAWLLAVAWAVWAGWPRRDERAAPARGAGRDERAAPARGAGRDERAASERLAPAPAVGRGRPARALAPASRRVALALAALAAPVVWLACDLVATGDPLHSLHGTQALAEQLGRPRELDTALRSTPAYLRYTLTAPVVWLGLAGCAAAIAAFYARTLLPLVVAGLGLLAFLALGVSGLPLLSRYLLLPAALLALWCAVAALGFTVAQEARGAWWAAGAVTLVVLGVTAHGVRDQLRGHVSFLGGRTTVERDLGAILASAPVRTALERCGGVLGLPDDAPGPHARRLVGEGVRVRGRAPVALHYADARARSVYVIPPAEPPGLPPGRVELARNGSWIASAAPGGCAAG